MFNHAVTATQFWGGVGARLRPSPRRTSLRNQHLFETGITRQSSLVLGVGLTSNEWLKIGSCLGGDAKTISCDEPPRHFLFTVGNAT
jgi:hypothetical protein